jgi:hypothetical protein
MANLSMEPASCGSGRTAIRKWRAFNSTAAWESSPALPHRAQPQHLVETRAGKRLHPVDMRVIYADDVLWHLNFR